MRRELNLRVYWSSTTTCYKAFTPLDSHSRCGVCRHQICSGAFRSVSLALLGLAPNILAAGLVLGVMGLVGIPLDIMTITIAAIVVGMGVDNCIHYIHRFRKEFAVDKNYREAMYRSHGSIGRAMYYTTLTVVVGFRC